MLQQHTTVHIVQKYFRPMTFAAAGLLLVGNLAWADGNNGGTFKKEVKNDRAVRLLATIPVPVTADNTTAGGLYSFDISWIDKTTGMYYLADRSNKRVDIVDADTGTFLTAINATPSFAGVSAPAFSSGTGGPNGVTTS